MEEREAGLTSVPGSNPDGKQRWRPHPGSRTRVALARPVWTLQRGGSKLLTEGAGQLSGEWSAAEGVGRRGRGGTGGEGRGEGERDAASAPLHARSGAGGPDPAGGQVTRGAGDRGGGWDTAAGGRGEDDRELGKEDPRVP